jgi:sulfate-transporting ATPase
VRGLEVGFGARRILHDVSFDLRAGEVLGVIGANGAGKTTLIDALTGYAPASGRIDLDGRDITRLPPHLRGRAGLVRSFQSLELFEDLTVGDNLMVACEDVGIGSHLTGPLRPGKPALSELANAAVHEFRLTAVLTASPAELSYGRRRLLAISRAVAAAPRVLLLDEPAAGLDDTDRSELRDLVRRLAAERGMAVLLIEHDVDLVMAVSDRVLALDFGRVIATGTPEEVRADPHVIAAYLGLDDEDEAADETAHDAEARR